MSSGFFLPLRLLSSSLTPDNKSTAPASSYALSEEPCIPCFISEEMTLWFFFLVYLIYISQIGLVGFLGMIKKRCGDGRWDSPRRESIAGDKNSALAALAELVYICLCSRRKPTIVFLANVERFIARSVNARKIYYESSAVLAGRASLSRVAGKTTATRASRSAIRRRDRPPRRLTFSLMNKHRRARFVCVVAIS